jgi:hypothetical protein
MSDEGYNGWKNYPTWAVNLWLANDEGLYREALERTEEEMASSRSARAKLERPYWTEEESYRFHVADMLKDWVTDELAPDLGASFASDLLGYALGEVEWHDIADAWIESVNDQVSA